ncbi:GAF domain-containing SpoIIE family protein phosphatase [Pelagicoccus mobilis]|uniref:SpoIIE family protein phosphatase n=1 Tax=Pelagicoccus mobilis TaxID=415221 RepID=A0A934VK38_9BACT|nr:GAF domain-containing SpoIIE family protein phosphatase [Pelagicoccus mobilis]MBK1876261.1 SpoIIE family protein phosphatase [Pelagicoccus mobilis]
MSLLFTFTLLLLAGFLGWLYFREIKRSSEYLERAQLAQQEKLIVADFMHEMVLALGDELGKEEFFQRIVHASIVSTGALSACVFEKTDRGTLKSVAVEGLFPPHRPLPEHVRAKIATRAKFIESVLKSEEFPITEGVTGEACRTRKTILVADGRTDPRVVKHDDASLRVTSAICAPIVFRDEVLGVLAVANSADGAAFSSTDASVVQSLAEQAGIAIRNKTFLTLLMERKQIDMDLAIARNIQLMLLPQSLPEIAGVELDARYVSSHTIGGDLYDVIPLGEQKFGLAVADVSGKGIPASLIMAICRTNLHRLAQREDSPLKVLKELNRAMTGEVKQDMYVTVFYAVVDLERSEIRFARAGHERPLLCSFDKSRALSNASFPDSEGFPVGMMEPEQFDPFLEEKCVPFVAGDIFVAFTDGVIETANSTGKEFSAARLADSVRSLRKHKASAINAGVLNALDGFSGKTSYDDDLTLLTVKRV